jgi:hypothetical protein
MKLNQFYDSACFKNTTPRIYEHNGRTIATTGQILISVPSNGAGNKTPIAARNRLTSLLAHIKRQDFIDLQKTQLPPPVTCSACQGKKRATTKICDTCSGEGQVLISGLDWVDCQKCQGEGETTTSGGDNDCKSCRGAGTLIPGHPLIKIMGLYVHPNHLNIIANEPGIEVATDIKNHLMFFRANDQEGVILGVAI